MLRIENVSLDFIANYPFACKVAGPTMVKVLVLGVRSKQPELSNVGRELVHCYLPQRLGVRIAPIISIDDPEPCDFEGSWMDPEIYD